MTFFENNLKEADTFGRKELYRKLIAAWDLLNRNGKEHVLNYLYDSLLAGKVVFSRKTRATQFHQMVLQSFLYGKWKPELRTVFDREFKSRIKGLNDVLLDKLLRRITEIALIEDYQK